MFCERKYSLPHWRGRRSAARLDASSARTDGRGSFGVRLIATLSSEMSQQVPEMKSTTRTNRHVNESNGESRFQSTGRRGATH